MISTVVKFSVILVLRAMALVHSSEVSTITTPPETWLSLSTLKLQPEPEPQSTSQPEQQTASEPSPESLSGSSESPELEEETSAANAEPISEAASESDTNVSSEPLAEELEKSSAESEASASGEPIAKQKPSTTEIVVPPVILILAIFLGLLVLLLRSRWFSVHKTLHGVSKTFLQSMINKTRISKEQTGQKQIKDTEITATTDKVTEVVKTAINDKPFFSQFDLEVLDNLRHCYNQPMELFRIALPAVISLGLCPLTILMFDAVRTYIWPEDKYPTRPDINDAVACYLAPAGLVYATSFGFAFQQVLGKQHEIMTKMMREISMLDQITTFTIKLQLNILTKMEILRAAKSECIFMVLQILNRNTASFKTKPSEDIRVKVWTLVDHLREVKTGGKNNVDRFLCENILNHVMKLNSICSDRMGILHTRINPVMWMFLETLGFFSFLGILLLTSFSYRMELVMCVITVFSISMLCYVISDLDSPFSGFFRVNIGVMEIVLKRLDLVHELMTHTGQVDVFYLD